MRGRDPSDGIAATLANGLRVAAIRVAGTRMASLEVRIGAGARHQADPRDGVAHMLEHMLFRGIAGRRGIEADAMLEDVGGSRNGFTDLEGTHFEASVLREDVEVALEAICPLATSRAAFTDADLDAEKRIVGEEIAESEPDLFALLAGTAYPKQGFGREILGEPRLVKGMKARDVEAFMETHYRPAGASVCIAADLDPSEMLERIASRMEGGWGRSGAGASPPPAPLYVGGDGREIRNRDKTGEVTIAFHSPCRFGSRGQTIEFAIADILSGGMTGRMVQEVRERRGLVYDCHSAREGICGDGFLSLEFDATPGKVAEAARVAVDCLERIGRDLTDLEVERWRKRLRVRMAGGWQSADAVCHAATAMMAHGLDPKTEVEVLDEIASVTREEIADHVTRLFNDRPTVVGRGAASQAPRADALWRRLRGGERSGVPDPEGP